MVMYNYKCKFIFCIYNEIIPSINAPLLQCAINFFHYSYFVQVFEIKYINSTAWQSM